MWSSSFAVQFKGSLDQTSNKILTHFFFSVTSLTEGHVMLQTKCLLDRLTASETTLTEV